MNMNRIGRNIANFRKKHQYTQETLANQLGVSPQAVSKWETGLGLPEISLLIELSKLFCVTVDEILDNDRSSTLKEFMNRNLIAPESKQLQHIPMISRWNPPDGCDMFYSMPAMIAEALCCIEAYDSGHSESVTMQALNSRFYDLMHIMGIGYGFLWREKGNLIEELWHINDFHEMVDHAMRYYGRDYLWLTKDNATPEDMRAGVVWSIHNGYPVVMEWAGGIPEFSIVTGYGNGGDTLSGWTYCPECAAKTNSQGMFVNPARWNEEFDFRVLLIGGKVEPTYSDKDSMRYALEVLDRKTPGDSGISDTVAGAAALQKWLNACSTAEDTCRLFEESSIYTYALQMNSIYTQKCILPYFRKLGERQNKQINDIVIQIGIAIGIITGERSSLNQLKDDTENYVRACRKHIENLMRHRDYMCDWLKSLYELL